MKYVILYNDKICIKKHYRNKIHLFFIKIYYSLKGYEII